jgi:hypothetical protein
MDEAVQANSPLGAGETVQVSSTLLGESTRFGDVQLRRSVEVRAYLPGAQSRGRTAPCEARATEYAESPANRDRIGARARLPDLT